MKDKPSPQNISGISFRELVTSAKEEKREEKPMSFNKESATFKEKVEYFFKSLGRRFKRVAVVRFFSELSSYISMRTRVIFILLGVISEYINTSTDGVRQVIVKSLYWGRGGLSKFSLQFITLVIGIFVFTFYLYRSSPSSASSLDNTFNIGKYELVSNTDLIVQRGSTNTQSPQERGNIEFTTYTVKGGDTLFRIADYHKVSVDTVLWANQFIEDEIIRPGDVLKIPPYDGVVAKAQKGDTVYTLAKKYKIDAQNIADKNYLEYPYELDVGKEYILPGATPLVKPKPKTSTIYSGVFNQRPTYTSGASSVSARSKFLNWPVSGGGAYVSQCYSGWNGGIHNGVDIASASNPKIVAAAPGKVVFAGCQSGSCPPRGRGYWGGVGLAWTVVIAHGNGFSTLYAHLDDIYVGSGSTVSAGQAIGKMGRTGYATGTHLHFMLLSGSWSSWKTVNPAGYFKSAVYSAHPSYCWY